jgi:hypothetical protein
MTASLMSVGASSGRGGLKTTGNSPGAVMLKPAGIGFGKRISVSLTLKLRNRLKIRTGTPPTVAAVITFILLLFLMSFCPPFCPKLKTHCMKNDEILTAHSPFVPPMRHLMRGLILRFTPLSKHGLGVVRWQQRTYEIILSRPRGEINRMKPVFSRLKYSILTSYIWYQNLSPWGTESCIIEVEWPWKRSRRAKKSFSALKRQAGARRRSNWSGSENSIGATSPSSGGELSWGEWSWPAR